MAYALGFPRDVTDLIYSMRDWRWEKVRKDGGTPSRLCFEIGPLPWQDGKPWLLALYVPYYTFESNSEEPDNGRVVLDHWNRDELASARIERSDIGNTLDIFVLSEPRVYGGVPPKLQGLQKKNDRRVEETWFQCEPCEAP
jgi:hypothetical protein